MEKENQPHQKSVLGECRGAGYKQGLYVTSFELMKRHNTTEGSLDLQQKKQLTKNQKHKLRKQLSWRKKVFQTHQNHPFLLTRQYRAQV